MLGRLALTSALCQNPSRSACVRVCVTASGRRSVSSLAWSQERIGGRRAAMLLFDLGRVEQRDRRRRRKQQRRKRRGGGRERGLGGGTEGEAEAHEGSDGRRGTDERRPEGSHRKSRSDLDGTLAAYHHPLHHHHTPPIMSGVELTVQSECVSALQSWLDGGFWKCRRSRRRKGGVEVG